MDYLIADLLQTAAGLTAAIFIAWKVTGEREFGPMSWPTALLCAGLSALLLYGFEPATVTDPVGWPIAIAIALLILGWGLWDQRHWLFGNPSSEVGQVPATGFSLFGTMLIGLAEELVFRGWLLSASIAFFQGPGGLPMALFATNLLFALLHANRGVTFAMSAGFFGMAMSMTVILSGSIWPAAITHTLWNLMVGLARQRSETAR